MALPSPGNAWEQRALKKANSYFADWKLHCWVGFQNTAHRVAPTTNLCLLRRQQICAEWDDSVKPTEHLDCTENRSRKWAQKWRRNGVPRSAGSVFGMHCLMETCTTGQQRVPTQSQNWTRKKSKKKNGAPEMVPINGPLFSFFYNQALQRHPTETPKTVPEEEHQTSRFDEPEFW